MRQNIVSALITACVWGWMFNCRPTQGLIQDCDGPLQRVRDQLREAPAYLTVLGKQDGVGAQAQAKITGMILAKALGFEYVDSGFVEDVHSHNSNHKLRADWDRTLNFGANVTRVEQLPQATQRAAVRLSHEDLYAELADPSFVPQPAALYTVRYAQSLINLPCLQERWIQPTYRAVADSLSRKYFSSAVRHPKLPCVDPAKVCVALHVRRGDVYKKKFVQNQYFIGVMANLRRVLREEGLEAEFHIYTSTGITKRRLFLDQFPEFVFDFSHASQCREVLHRHSGAAGKLCHSSVCLPGARGPAGGDALEVGATLVNVSFHINGPAADALHWLAASDVLVGSLSDYSLLAGVLQRGVVVTPAGQPLVHPDWLVANISDGSLEAPPLRPRLRPFALHPPPHPDPAPTLEHGACTPATHSSSTGASAGGDEASEHDDSDKGGGDDGDDGGRGESELHARSSAACSEHAECCDGGATCMLPRGGAEKRCVLPADAIGRTRAQGCTPPPPPAGRVTGAFGEWGRNWMLVIGCAGAVLFARTRHARRGQPAEGEQERDDGRVIMAPLRAQVMRWGQAISSRRAWKGGGERSQSQ